MRGAGRWTRTPRAGSGAPSREADASRTPSGRKCEPAPTIRTVTGPDGSTTGAAAYYDAFGAVTARTGAATPFGFTGAPQSGDLVHLNARDPYRPRRLDQESSTADCTMNGAGWYNCGGPATRRCHRSPSAQFETNARNHVLAGETIYYVVAVRHGQRAVPDGVSVFWGRQSRISRGRQVPERVLRSWDGPATARPAPLRRQL